jgi:hypothetical protein
VSCSTRATTPTSATRRDRFGGWVRFTATGSPSDACWPPEGRTVLLDAGARAAGADLGRGPAARETSEAYAISLTGGGDRWQSGSERHGEVGAPIMEAEFDLAPFRGSTAASPWSIRQGGGLGATPYGSDALLRIGEHRRPSTLRSSQNSYYHALGWISGGNSGESV